MQSSPFSNSPFADAPERVEIERELEAGERLLWAGRPVPAAWKREKRGSLGNKIAATAFMLFWMWGASQALVQAVQAGRTPTLIDVVFPAFGLIFLFGVARDWFTPLSAASRTFYGVTDQRAMIVVAGRTREVRSFAPHQIQLGRREHGDGSGDVLLNDARVYQKEKPPRSFQLHTPQKSDDEKSREVGFIGIENPREVERLIRTELLKSL